MIITMLQVKKVDTKAGKLIGVAAITLDNMIAVHDIKILTSENGYMLAMPNKKTPTGVFRDIVHPISSDVRKALEGLVFSAVDELMKSEESLMSLKPCEDCTKSSILEQSFTDFFLVENSI